MSLDKAELTEAQKRRRRINLYKKIIVSAIIFLILLPTMLCAVLFFKINSLNKDINRLRKEMSDSVDYIRDNNPDNNSPNNGNAGIVDNKDNIVDNIYPDDSNSAYEYSGEYSSDRDETDEGHTDTGDDRTDADATLPPEDNPEETLQTEDGRETVASPNAESSNRDLVAEAVKQGRKVVYLTYDDGPSRNTGELLDVLNEYGVKVTFFTIKNTMYEEYVNRLVDEGHTLAMHTLTHNYQHVYESLESFKEEVDGISDYLYDLTGVRPYVFRFPGGSSNSQTTVPVSTYIEYLNSKKIVYYDWNVSSGDGGSEQLTVEQIYNNVISGVEKNDISVVLMHDSEYKETTLRATPLIIEKLQEMNALILPITADTVPVHHNVN